MLSINQMVRVKLETGDILESTIASIVYCKGYNYSARSGKILFIVNNDIAKYREESELTPVNTPIGDFD